MKKYEPWIVAAAYLMQKANGRAHYTSIVDYILDTELTELTERNVATSQIVNDTLKQKVINGRAVFQSQGNGYYSLDNKDALVKNEEIQGVVQSLKDKGMNVNLHTHEDEEKKPIIDDQIPGDDNETLSNEARKLSEETRKLSDETRKLSDETMKLSEEVRKLSNENKNLRKETGSLRQENQQLKEKLQSIKQFCEV